MRRKLPELLLFGIAAGTLNPFQPMPEWPMRVVTWNLQAGGGRRVERFADVLLQESADLAALTEFRLGAGGRLLQRLEPLGYGADIRAQVPAQNSVCLLSREAMVPHVFAGAPKSGHRWCSVRLPNRDLSVLAVHVPNKSEIWDKRDFWNSINDYTEAQGERRSIILGDLNTALDEDCQGAKIQEAEHLKALFAKGWSDAWRSCFPEVQEYTWFSQKPNGFRLDYCLLSPGLRSSLRAAGHRHDVRVGRLSDHSLLWAELEI